MKTNLKTVVLDYGHGGIDRNGNYTTAPAKQAKVNGEMVYEGHINRVIGSMLKTLLQWSGYRVIETVRAEDPRDLSLGYRVRKANQYSQFPLISIHCNAFNGKARGFEIFTSRGQTASDPLAESIANEVQKLYKRTNLKLRFDTSDGDKDKEADFYVLRKTRGVAVLVECLFFDNPEDLAKLQDVDFLKDFVAALYHGINNWIQNR